MQVNSSRLGAFERAIEEIEQEFEPCGIKEGKCNGSETGEKVDIWCCKACPALKNRGCSIGRPISCRLWFCEHALKRIPAQKIKQLEVLATALNNSGMLRYRDHSKGTNALVSYGGKLLEVPL